MMAVGVSTLISGRGLAVGGGGISEGNLRNVQWEGFKMINTTTCAT